MTVGSLFWSWITMCSDLGWLFDWLTEFFIVHWTYWWWLVGLLYDLSEIDIHCDHYCTNAGIFVIRQTPRESLNPFSLKLIYSMISLDVFKCSELSVWMISGERRWKCLRGSSFWSPCHQVRSLPYSSLLNEHVLILVGVRYMVSVSVKCGLFSHWNYQMLTDGGTLCRIK